MSKNKQQKKLNLKSILTLIVLAVALVVGVYNGWMDGEDQEANNTTAAITAPQDIADDNGGSAAIIAPQDIADYIFDHGKLPDNFITKKEAQELGWDNSKNDVSDVAPGKSIGGDRFGNYEGLLEDAPGRIWYEADANYTGGNRGAERIVFSNDGLVYYTSDHYESFTEMKPSK